MTIDKPNLREWFNQADSLVLICTLLLINCASAEDRLYAFIPNDARPQVLQENLSKSCPGISITVFGRIRDFKAKVELENPEAILSFDPVVQLFKDYSITLYGTYKGSKSEEYILLSIDDPLNTKDLSNKTIGILDFMGRKEIADFIQDLFLSPPALKRVSKLEDLLPLLTFKMVDAIFVSARDVQYFRTKSKLNFVVNKLDNLSIRLPVLGVRRNAVTEKIENAIRNLDKTGKALLGIEEWRK